MHVEPAGAQQRFRLRCVGGSLAGFEIDLLHPFESVEPVTRDLDPERAGRLPAWLLYHEAFLLEQALGPRALAAVQPGRLEIAPFQLVPVMRALEMTRPRLLLADGVGLGKTVQAGLVLAELIARRRAHRILIVSPAGPLLTQWQQEMRSRFGLRFEDVRDWGSLQEVRRGIELGANPFDAIPLCLLSIDFAKQEKVLQDLERTSWDIVVVDEAHHCVRMGGAADRDDSLRRRLAEVLARQCDGVLLLTATPHDGFDAHFASLVELLDPSLVDGRGGLRGDRYRRHVIRRLKHHVKDPVTGDPLFQTREVTPRPVAIDPSARPRFAALQRDLLALVAPRLESALRTRRYGEVLAFVSLLKRSVSSARACRKTLGVIRERFEKLVAEGAEAQELRRQRLQTLRDYRARLERYGTLDFEEEQDQQLLEGEDMAAELFRSAEDVAEEAGAAARELRRDADRTRRLRALRDALACLESLAAEAEAEDPKLDALVAELRQIRAHEPRANVLVYTEYTDTLGAITERLERERTSGALSGEVLALTGAGSSEPGTASDSRAREAVTARFCRDEDLVLVSTDATAEGLNLHRRCHHLVHAELPYNPNRLEQRNGRIDRYGQKEVPRVRYLYLAGTFEERILLRLVAKWERQRARLTFVPNTLGVFASPGAAASVRLLEGLAEEEPLLFERGAAELRFDAGDLDEGASEATRELLAEVDRALSGYERAARSAAWLADAGSSADESLVRGAEEARAKGRVQGAVDLLGFVCAALESETGSATAATPNGDNALTLSLPPDWCPGLDGLPGFDPSKRTMRIATDPTLEAAEREATLGFLGRAHPLVLRALDRVRMLQHGEGGALLDRRVAAAFWDEPAPALLFTFLATVQSEAGRELERVGAALVRRGAKPEIFFDPARWLGLARPERAAPTAGVFARHFAGWYEGEASRAAEALLEVFDPIAAEFTHAHCAAMASEAIELDRWLASRVNDLLGERTLVTPDLFARAPDETPAWQRESDPRARLAAFAKDPAVAASRRREAEGLLRLHDARRGDVDARARLAPAAATLLGLLLLVPRGSA